MCLDTTALSDSIHAVPAIRERLEALKVEGRPLPTTAINAYEVEVGVERERSDGLPVAVVRCQRARSRRERAIRIR
jgi:hypothetical protein